jgi:hypothetical protein
MVFGPTLESVAVLGIIVVIRLLVSFSLEVQPAASRSVSSAWRGAASPVWHDDVVVVPT